MRDVRRTLLVGLTAGAVLLLPEPYQGSARRAYEAYYDFIGNYPNEANTGWHAGAQGLTHDRDNWFVTQSERLWKIPVTHDLNNVSCGGGVVCRSLNDIRGLSAEGYTHLGDPEYYEFSGKGYVLVPVEAPVEGATRLAPSAIAAFDADTLEYIAHAHLPGQIDAPWVAVDPQGNVYSSNFDNVTAINKFGLDWGSLSNTENPRLILSAPTISTSIEDRASGLFATEPLQRAGPGRLNRPGIPGDGFR